MTSACRPVPRALALLPLLLLALLPGCLTVCMWDKLDDSRGERIAAACLTPITLTVDAVAFAAIACCDAPRGCRPHCHRGCR